MDPERTSGDRPGGEPGQRELRNAYRSGLLTAAHRIRAAGFLRDVDVAEQPWLEDALTELEEEGDGRHPVRFEPDTLGQEPPRPTGA